MSNYQYCILKLIIDYIRQNKAIDLKFIDKIIEIVVNEKGLHDYVKKFQPYQDDFVISYNVITKIISGNIENIIKDIPQEFFYLNYDDRMLNNFSHVAWCTIHELYHARDYKKCIINQKDIETKILRESYYKPLIKNYIFLRDRPRFPFVRKRICKIQENRYQLYKSLWHFAPFERIANIDAIQDIVSIAEELRSYILWNYMTCRQQNFYLNAYNLLKANNITCSPTKFYLEKYDKKRQGEFIEKMGKNLPFIDRLRLGLEIKETASETLLLNLIKK